MRVEVGDLREEAFGKRLSGSGRHKERMPGSLDRAAWAVKQNISEGRCSGGPHTRLSRRTELVGVSLTSGRGDPFLSSYFSAARFTFGRPGK
jgi:hypothetical protein